MIFKESSKLILKRKDILVPPSKLLESARELLETQNKRFFRPVVLESITALEVFVRELIIDSLEKGYGRNVRNGIERRTQFSFEDRLDWVMELVTGKTLKEENKMWRKFKEVRTIRNKVIHRGLRITYKDARRAYNLVESIIGFLLGEIGIPRFLEEYKKIVEEEARGRKKLEEKELEDFLRRKFKSFEIGEVVLQPRGARFRPDIFYKAGGYKFIIELARVKTRQDEFNIFAMIKNINKLSGDLNLDKIFIIVMLPRDDKVERIFFADGQALKKLKILGLKIL